MSDDEDAVAALLDELAEAPPDDALDAAAERLAEDALAAACAEELEDAAAVASALASSRRAVSQTGFANWLRSIPDLSARASDRIHLPDTRQKPPAPRRPNHEINGFLVHLHARARNAVGQPQIHRIDHGGRGQGALLTHEARQSTRRTHQ